MSSHRQALSALRWYPCGLTQTNMMNEELSKRLSDLKKNDLVDVVKFITSELGEQGSTLLAQALSKLSEKSITNERRPESKSNKQDFKFENCRQRHISLQIQYDGGKFYGFAAQEGQETIEHHLFEALMKLKLIEDPKTCNYSRCGRTDKGVSAFGQIVALHLRSALPKDLDDSLLPKHPSDTVEVWTTPKPKKNAPTNVTEEPKVRKIVQEMDYCTMLNNVLPAEIRVIGWSPVTPEFSSRFSAISRTYRYFFLQKSLNIGLMSQATKLLLGKHDFRNFCKIDIANVSNFEREIFSAEIKLFSSHAHRPEENVYMLEISGIAFLWHMVRCIMAVLFVIGEEHESPEIITSLFDVAALPGKPSYQMAPDQPLVLYHCGFDRLTIYKTPKTLWHLTGHYTTLYEEAMLMAMRAKNALQTIQDTFVVRREDVEQYTSTMLDTLKKKHPQLLLPQQEANNTTNKRKFDELVVTPTEEKKGIVDSSGKELISWAEAMKLILQVTGIPHPNDCGAQYIPLLQRKKEETYEERLQLLSGLKKQRYEKHAKTHEAHRTSESECPETEDNSPQESFTDKFFARMRLQGSL